MNRLATRWQHRECTRKLGQSILGLSLDRTWQQLRRRKCDSHNESDDHCSKLHREFVDKWISSERVQTE